jgi:hypothetical protein
MFYELNISMFPDAVEVDTKDLCDDLKCYRHPKFMRLMPKFGFLDADQYESIVFVNNHGVICDILNFQSSPAYQEFVAAIPGVYR